MVRALMELDVAKPPPRKIQIGNDQNDMQQKVKYEEWFEYCSFCECIGHSMVNCFKKNLEFRRGKDGKEHTDHSSKLIYILKVKNLDNDVGGKKQLVEKNGKDAASPAKELNNQGDDMVMEKQFYNKKMQDSLDHQAADVDHGNSVQLIDENNGNRQLTQQNAYDVEPATRENYRMESNQVQFPCTHNAFQVLENENDEIDTELCKLQPHSNT